MTTLLSYLVAAADQHPDRPAVIEDARRLTYRELHERSTALAAELARAGAGPGQRVGIHLPSGLDAVVAVWATLKTGAAYVPVDVAKPAERRARVLDEIDPKVVVTTGSFDLDCGRETVDVAAAYDGPLKAPPEVTVRPDDPAYIFYTSGSTGAPKAVVLTHRNATTFVDWAVRAFKITTSDRIACHAPVHCDLSTFDLFGSVKAAATLVAVPTPARASGKELASFLHDSSCTVLYCVPSALTMLVEAAASASALGSLRVVLFGGEICPQATLRAMLRLTTNTRFANLYGLTATNVCIFHEVDPVLDLVGHSLPIGRAITPEVQARVMAAPNREAEIGEPGELVVSGPVVAQGYWDDPALTRARFAPDDASAVALEPAAATRAYRTGDIAVRRPNGSLYRRCRADRQVSTPGSVVELDEVESAFYANPDVVEAAVLAAPDERGDNRLIAAVVTRKPTSADRLRRACGRVIPADHVPSAIQIVESLPRTSTGKIDRHSLLAQFTGSLSKH